MSIPTYDDWLQWKDRNAIAECGLEARGRIGAWIQQVLRAELWQEQRECLGDYFEDSAEARGNCASAFDQHMLKIVKDKETGELKTPREELLAARPLNEDGTKKAEFTNEEQAIAWAGFAGECIRNDVARELRTDLPRIKGRPKGSPPARFVPIEAPTSSGGGGAGRSVIEIEPGTDPSIEDQVTAREIEELLPRFPLEERERLILWSDLARYVYSSTEMWNLTGVRRQQLYECQNRLEARLKSWLIEVFKPLTLPNAMLSLWSNWAWGILVRLHGTVRPERIENGPLRWVCVKTKEIVQPEKQPDGSFIWKRVAAPAATPNTPVL